MTGAFRFGTVMLYFQETGFRFTQSGACTLIMLTNTVEKHKPPGDLYVVQQVDLNAYKEDGAVLLNSVFDESWIAELRQSADRALSQSENYFHRQWVWENDKTCREFCLNSAAVSLALRFSNRPKSTCSMTRYSQSLSAIRQPRGTMICLTGRCEMDQP